MDALDIGVVRLQPLQSIRPAPGARVHLPRNATASVDDPLCPAALIGTVAIGRAGALGRIAADFAAS